MLNKLFQHDFKNIGRYMLPLTAGYPAVTLASLVFQQLMVGTRLENTAAGLAFLIIFMGILALYVTLIVASVQYFNQTMLFKESYLTHMIPIKMETIVLSKLLAPFCWLMITFAVSAFVGVMSVMFFSDPHSLFQNIFTLEALRILPRILLPSITFPLLAMSYIILALSMTGLPAIAGRKILSPLAFIGVLVGIPWLFFTVSGWLLGPKGSLIAYEGVRGADGAIGGGFRISLDPVMIGNHVYLSCALFTAFAVLFFFASVYVLKNHRAVVGE